MSPELIAINELFFDEPVAKALGPADWKIPISGINTPSAQSLSLGLMIDFI